VSRLPRYKLVLCHCLNTCLHVFFGQFPGQQTIRIVSAWPTNRHPSYTYVCIHTPLSSLPLPIHIHAHTCFSFTPSPFCLQARAGTDAAFAGFLANPVLSRKVKTGIHPPGKTKEHVPTQEQPSPHSVQPSPLQPSSRSCMNSL